MLAQGRRPLIRRPFIPLAERLILEMTKALMIARATSSVRVRCGRASLGFNLTARHFADTKIVARCAMFRRLADPAVAARVR